VIVYEAANLRKVQALGQQVRCVVHHSGGEACGSIRALRGVLPWCNLHVLPITGSDLVRFSRLGKASSLGCFTKATHRVFKLLFQC
jgi:NAD(P)H-dependent FMN reductase